MKKMSKCLLLAMLICGSFSMNNTFAAVGGNNGNGNGQGSDGIPGNGKGNQGNGKGNGGPATPTQVVTTQSR